MFTSQLSAAVNSTMANNYVCIVGDPVSRGDDISDIMSQKETKPRLVLKKNDETAFYNDFKSRFMPVENFSLNPENLNIQYIPLQNRIDSNPDLYGIDLTMPKPFKLTSKSPLYGPGLIVENG